MVDEPEKKDEIEEVPPDDEPEGLTETDEKIDEDVAGDDKEEAAETGEVKDEEAEATEAKAPEFDSEILSIAADLGVSNDKARGFSTVADLEKHLYGLTEQRSDEPEKKVAVPGVGKDEKQTPVLLEAGDDLDEALVGKINDALGKITGRYDERYAGLEKTITGLQENLQASQAAQFISQFDRMLTEYGGGYSELLGEGNTMALNPNGKEAERRADIIQVMQTTVQVCQSGNRKVPSDEQLIKRAMTEVCGEPTVNKDKLNGKVQSRQGQSLRRASSRSGRPVTAADKRRDAERDLQEKLNALSSDEDVSVYEETNV